MPKKKKTLLEQIKKIIMLAVGAMIAAAGLEIFMVPNDIIDGGIVGISIITGYLTHIPYGLIILAFNIPFLYLGYLQIGKSFAVSTLFAVSALAFWINMFSAVPPVTKDLFLASIFGGIIVGLGVGIIIRYGGSLDGTEVVAIILDEKTGFSVGEIVMFFNLFILASAGLVFSWEKAMYSLVAYFIAFKVIDITIEGLDESKGVLIISDYPDEIKEILMHRLGRGVTVLYGEGAYTGVEKKVLYSVITRLEVSKLKSIVREIDDNAFVVISDVHDVLGGHIKKRAIH